ncbi:hypothetical protein HCBG_07394 [Histoplasma capsulatum G186AR]|uniref:Uncharacterized protein n=1 Tax=Ajellomyces capsulatus (strain G186AR / H82 / ATCC MYA-2454 / RMSCC 2432) TaxID=447093 RepID=C0NW64_AJECG|nr:uncharacterized protein HCBG_07394 [Histoplasma capsulatum G186AR]EEH04169.1 hypothetical protein HCBG_07394 [Histoplasma capsulatum G186AR]
MPPQKDSRFGGRQNNGRRARASPTPPFSPKMASSSQDKRMVDVIGSEEPGVWTQDSPGGHASPAPISSSITETAAEAELAMPSARCPGTSPLPCPGLPGAGSSSYRSRIYIRETPGDGPAIQKSQILRRIPQVLYGTHCRVSVNWHGDQKGWQEKARVLNPPFDFLPLPQPSLLSHLYIYSGGRRGEMELDSSGKIPSESVQISTCRISNNLPSAVDGAAPPAEVGKPGGKKGGDGLPAERMSGLDSATFARVGKETKLPRREEGPNRRSRWGRVNNPRQYVVMMALWQVQGDDNMGTVLGAVCVEESILRSCCALVNLSGITQLPASDDIAPSDPHAIYLHLLAAGTQI